MSTKKSANGKGWLTTFQYLGKPYSKTHRSYKEGQAWERDTKEQAKVMKHSIAGGISFGQACLRYAEERSPDKAGAKWEQVRLRRIANQCEIGKVALEDMDKHSGLAHMTTLRIRKLKPNSIIREMTVLKCVLRQCDEWYKLPYPWDDLKMPTANEGRRRLITDEEVARMTDASGYKIGTAPEDGYQMCCAMWLFAIESAMRMGEIAQAVVTDLNLSRNILIARDCTVKTRTPRDVPLSPTANKILIGLGDRGPHDLIFGQSSGVCSAMFAKLRNRAGLSAGGKESWFTFHDSRHLACTRMSRIPDMDMLKLSAITGHTDPRMLKRYYNEDASRLADMLASAHYAKVSGTKDIGMIVNDLGSVEALEAQLAQFKKAQASERGVNM